MHKLCAYTLVAVGLSLTGCGSSKQNDEKAQELSKELERTKQELAEARAQANEAAQDADRNATSGTPTGTAPAAPPAPRSPRPPTKETSSSRPAAGQQPPASSEAETRQNAVAEQTRPPAQTGSNVAAAPRLHVVPAGTAIRIRTISPLSTKTARAGSTFEATLAEPLVVDGYTVAKRGATVTGVVASSDPGGRTRGRASLTLGLRSIAASNGQSLEVRTEDVSRTAASSVKKDAAKVGIATGVGAAIGAIAGGGKGAAIGAGVGAAGGTGVAVATRGDAAEIPSETVLTFTLSAPVNVREGR